MNDKNLDSQENKLKKIKRAPELRFKGFSDDWEQRKLSDLTEYADYRGKSPSKKENGIQLITASNIRFGYIDYDVDKQYVSKDDYPEIMRRGLPKMGDVLFTTEAPLGNVAQVDSENIALAQRVIKFTGKRDLIINDYLFEYFLTPSFQTEINKKASGGTVKGIKGKVLHQTLINFPKLLEEQQKIGTFFKQLDDTLALHQRKLDKLKQLKQGYLQQLFPKPGETVPKIRFANFEAYWQERKLGELTQIKTGSGDLQDADSNGKFPFFVRSNNIEKSNRYIFDGEAVLIPGEGRLGDIYHYINGKFDYHQRVYKISNFSDSNMCGRFVLYELRRNFKRHALKFTVKATVDSLRLPILKNYKIKFPETQEQINIGNFLSELDIYIDFSQKRLTKLKICKKAFLQEMFL